VIVIGNKMKGCHVMSVRNINICSQCEIVFKHRFALGVVFGVIQHRMHYVTLRWNL